MKIKNPLDKDLSLSFKGTDYVLEAGVSKEFPTDVTAQWILIYGFLDVTETTNKDTDAVVEAVEEAKKEAKPAKKTAKKAVKEDKKEEKEEVTEE